LLPVAAYRALVDWGQQEARVDDASNPRWLIPASPFADRPMRAVKITRTVNQYARKALQSRSH